MLKSFVGKLETGDNKESLLNLSTVALAYNDSGHLFLIDKNRVVHEIGGGSGSATGSSYEWIKEDLPSEALKISSSADHTLSYMGINAVEGVNLIANYGQARVSIDGEVTEFVNCSGSIRINNQGGINVTTDTGSAVGIFTYNNQEVDTVGVDITAAEADVPDAIKGNGSRYNPSYYKYYLKSSIADVEKYNLRGKVLKSLVIRNDNHLKCMSIDGTRCDQLLLLILAESTTNENLSEGYFRNEKNKTVPVFAAVYGRTVAGSGNWTYLRKYIDNAFNPNYYAESTDGIPRWITRAFGYDADKEYTTLEIKSLKNASRRETVRPIDHALSQRNLLYVGQSILMTRLAVDRSQASKWHNDNVLWVQKGHPHVSGKSGDEITINISDLGAGEFTSNGRIITDILGHSKLPADFRNKVLLRIKDYNTGGIDFVLATRTSDVDYCTVSDISTNTEGVTMFIPVALSNLGDGRELNAGAVYYNSSYNIDRVGNYQKSKRNSSDTSHQRYYLADGTQADLGLIRTAKYHQGQWVDVKRNRVSVNPYAYDRTNLYKQSTTFRSESKLATIADLRTAFGLGKVTNGFTMDDLYQLAMSTDMWMYRCSTVSDHLFGTGDRYRHYTWNRILYNRERGYRHEEVMSLNADGTVNTELSFYNLIFHNLIGNHTGHNRHLGSYLGSSDSPYSDHYLDLICVPIEYGLHGRSIYRSDRGIKFTLRVHVLVDNQFKESMQAAEENKLDTMKYFFNPSLRPYIYKGYKISINCKGIVNNPTKIPVLD